MTEKISESDLHYLRSIKMQMQLIKEAWLGETRFSLQGVTFADTIDWLDCFIEKHERK